MPLSINVGLSRKASKDYQSTGVSINVTAELDQSLLARPDELQQQIGSLYQQAEESLNRQADRIAGSTSPARNGNGRGYSNGHRNGNGRYNGSTKPNGSITASQRRCIDNIASRLNIDANQEAIDIIGTDLAQMSVKQASDLIDHLRSLGSPAGNGGGQ